MQEVGRKERQREVAFPPKPDKRDIDMYVHCLDLHSITS